MTSKSKNMIVRTSSSVDVLCEPKPSFEIKDSNTIWAGIDKSENYERREMIKKNN